MNAVIESHLNSLYAHFRDTNKGKFARRVVDVETYIKALENENDLLKRENRALAIDNELKCEKNEELANEIKRLKGLK